MLLSVDEATEMLARTPGVLRALLGGVSDAWACADEGTETFRPVDVVGHLLNGELTDWMPRVRHVFEHGESRPFEPFDRWGHRGLVERTSLDGLLDRFETARRESLAALEALHLGPDDLKRSGRHPDFGTVTLEQLLAAWVVHDLGHIRQVCRVIAGRYRDTVGPWRAYLPVLGEGPVAR